MTKMVSLKLLKNGFNLNILFNNNNPQSNQHRLRVIRYFMMMPLAIFNGPAVASSFNKRTASSGATQCKVLVLSKGSLSCRQVFAT